MQIITKYRDLQNEQKAYYKDLYDSLLKTYCNVDDSNVDYVNVWQRRFDPITNRYARPAGLWHRQKCSADGVLLLLVPTTGSRFSRPRRACGSRTCRSQARRTRTTRTCRSTTSTASSCEAPERCQECTVLRGSVQRMFNCFHPKEGGRGNSNASRKSCTGVEVGECSRAGRHSLHAAVLQYHLRVLVPPGGFVEKRNRVLPPHKW